MEALLAAIRKLLEEKQTEDPVSETELVAYHMLNTESGSANIEATLLVDGIRSGVPVSRIIGYSVISGSKILINEDVLGPGPETKTLVEKVIVLANTMANPKILDVCTGPGSIAIAISRNIGLSAVVGTDISDRALKVARLNAEKNFVEIDFRQGDLFGPVSGELFDIIVANPPYVKTPMISQLPSFVRDFAPLVAIDGGDDGLDLHRRILSEASNYLKSTGSLLIECEDGQDIELLGLFKTYDWKIEEEYLNRFGRVRGFHLVKYRSKSSP